MLGKYLLERGEGGVKFNDTIEKHVTLNLIFYYSFSYSRVIYDIELVHINTI